MSRDPFTYHWVEEQRIMAGSLPTSPEDIGHLRNKEGIAAILSLTRRDLDCSGMGDYLYGIVRLHCPIPDGQPPDDVAMYRALDFIRHITRDTGDAVYVHCRAGYGRTGSILMAYYVLYCGYTLGQARDKVRVRIASNGQTAADVTAPQRQWLEALAAKVGKS